MSDSDTLPFSHPHFRHKRLREPGVLHLLQIRFCVLPDTERSHLHPVQHLRLLHRLRPFRNPERVMARVHNSLEQYRDTAAFFKQEPKIILEVFLITLVQRFCLFSVIWLTYLAFGLSGQSAVTMILLHAMISVAVDMLPLPGGMGISETLFLSIFEPIFGVELVLPGMIVCRGISYYTQLVISGVMTGVAQFVFREKKRK